MDLIVRAMLVNTFEPNKQFSANPFVSLLGKCFMMDGEIIHLPKNKFSKFVKKSPHCKIFHFISTLFQRHSADVAENDCWPE